MTGVWLNDENKHQIGFGRATTNARSRADATSWLLCIAAEC